MTLYTDDLSLLRAALTEVLREGQRMSQTLDATQTSLIRAGELIERSTQLVDKILASATDTPKNNS